MSDLTFSYIQDPDRELDHEVHLGDIITLLNKDGSEPRDYVVVSGHCDGCALTFGNGEGGCLNYNFECLGGRMLKRVSDTMEEL